MKHILLTVILLSAISITSYAQTPANPIIQDYGTIYGLDNVALPDKNQEYKIVIDLKSSNDNFDKVNKGLVNVARALNLHGVAGIPQEQLHVSIAIHLQLPRLY